MQYEQGSLQTTVGAVLGFLDKYAERLGARVMESGARQRVIEIATVLDTNGREQAARDLAARAATIRRRAARRALIAEHMYPIAVVASTEIDNFAQLAALHMPPLRVNDEQLIQLARGMASAATEQASVFAAGLAGDDFAAELEAATTELVEAGRERTDCVASRRKATANLEATTRAARKRLRVLDVYVKAAIKGDTGMLVEWKRVRKVAVKPGPARGAGTAEGGESAPQIVPAISAQVREQQAA